MKKSIIDYKIKRPKEIFQIAKEEKKVNLLKNISTILMNEIMIDEKYYGTAEQTLTYLLRKQTIPTTHVGIINWFIAWERYFKSCDRDGYQRLSNARKGIRPIYVW